VIGAAVPPGPTQSDSGWYVYGVVASAEVPDGLFAGTEGVHPVGSVVLVTDGDLAAIVSNVPLEQFGQEAIEEYLHDEAWLEEKVRAHESVLEAALLQAPLVPFRFGTIYRSEEQIRKMLRENAYLTRTLERLRGTMELGVKAFLDVEAFERKHGGEAENESSESGRAYLLRKQLGRRLVEERASFTAACAQESHERLSAVAEEGRANPLQRPEISGRAGVMVLNGAYLVQAENQEAFKNALAALKASYEPEGVRYELTGPWPPYNFVEVEPER
jgi:hypothetical protein